MWCCSPPVVESVCVRWGKSPGWRHAVTTRCTSARCHHRAAAKSSSVTHSLWAVWVERVSTRSCSKTEADLNPSFKQSLFENRTFRKRQQTPVKSQRTYRRKRWVHVTVSWQDVNGSRNCELSVSMYVCVFVYSGLGVWIWMNSASKQRLTSGVRLRGLAVLKYSFTINWKSLSLFLSLSLTRCLSAVVTKVW